VTDIDILKIIRGFFLMVVLIFVVGAAVIVVSGIVTEKKEVEINESLAEEMTGPYRDDGHDIRIESLAAEREEMNARGDPGDDERATPSDSEKNAAVFDTGRPRSRKALIEIALEYNGYIPFASGGRSFEKGFHKYRSGIDNRGKPPELQTGLDSWGYVMWLFRNTFGEDGDEWLSPEALSKTAAEVKREDLQVGDIGMLYPPGENGNHFGVCVGYIDGIPVFSHCANIPAEGYPCGNSRLSCLSAEEDLYMHGSAPVGFTCFFRPAVAWEEEP